MLSRLSFTNFKSWPEADLTFAPITGLFGTNSSGKTSLLQFLLMLKQTKEATDRAIALELNGAYVQLGTIRDAIHGHDETGVITLSLTFTPDDPLSLQDSTGRNQRPIASGEEITLSTKIVVRQKAPQAESLSYTLGDVSFSLKRGSGKEKPFDLAASDPSGKFRFIRTQGRPWGLPGPVKSYAFPDERPVHIFRTQRSLPIWKPPTRRPWIACSTSARSANTPSVITFGPDPAGPMSAERGRRQSTRFSRRRKRVSPGT